MERSIFSIGILASRACSTAMRRRKFAAGSPPPPSRTATTISRPRRVKICPRLASFTPFCRHICAHFEWPDIVQSPPHDSGRNRKQAGALPTFSYSHQQYVLLPKDAERRKALRSEEHTFELQ